MYFDASESLLNEVPSLQTQIEAIDHFFGSRLPFGDVVAPATEIAKKTQIEVPDVHRVLHRLVEKNALSRLFLPMCTCCGDITGFYQSFDAVPNVFTCDECGESHEKDETNVFLMYQAQKDSLTSHPTQGRGDPSAEIARSLSSKFIRGKNGSVVGSTAPDIGKQDSLRATCETLQITIEHLHLGNNIHDQSVRLEGQSRYDGGTHQDIRSLSGAVHTSQNEKSTHVSAEGHSNVKLDQKSGARSEYDNWKWMVGIFVSIIIGLATICAPLYTSKPTAPEAEAINKNKAKASIADGSDSGLSAEDTNAPSAKKRKQQHFHQDSW